MSKAQQTLDICHRYRTALAKGENESEVVGYLAATYDVQRPAIWKALRRGGVIEPYRRRQDGGKGRPVGGGSTGYSERRRAASLAQSAAGRPPLPEVDPSRCVDRDPCPRCGVRRDIGCGHSQAPLGMIL